MPAKFPCDAVCATVRQNNGKLHTYSSSFDRTYRYTGTAEKPWQNIKLHMNVSYFDNLSTYAQEHTSEYVFDFGTPRYHRIENAGDSVGFYFKNIYRVDAGELIGFVHAEYYHQGRPPQHAEADVYPAYYSIGLCRSANNGNSWTFCGDILRPFMNYTGDASFNIGGAPCLVVGDYLYIYFNEVNSVFDFYPGVARAKLRDVIDSARIGHVAAWKKWTGDTTWNADACGIAGKKEGLGNRVIPASVLNGIIDVHTDAAYCSSIKKYLITATLHDTLFILQSEDGLSWKNPQLVAGNNLGTAGSIPQFPFFVSISGQSSKDYTVIGNKFYIYFLNRLPSPLNKCPNPPGNEQCIGEFRKDGTDFPLWRVLVHK
jgi:hypothetical protein